MRGRLYVHLPPQNAGDFDEGIVDLAIKNQVFTQRMLAVALADFGAEAAFGWMIGEKEEGFIEGGEARVSVLKAECLLRMRTNRDKVGDGFMR